MTVFKHRLGFVCLCLSIFAASATLAPRKAEANPGLLVLASIAAVIAQYEGSLVFDTEIARAFDDDLVLKKRAFDKSKWPYQVTDERGNKHVSYSFQTEAEGRAFMEKWAEQKRTKGVNAPPAF